MERDYWSPIGSQRFSRRRAIALGGSAGAVGAILAACGSSNKKPGESGASQSSLITPMEDSSKQAKRGGVLKWYTPLEPNNFDPTVSTFGVGVIVQAYDHLVEFQPGLMKLGEDTMIPGVAESW